jgi:hypothetical protein
MITLVSIVDVFVKLQMYIYNCIAICNFLRVFEAYENVDSCNKLLELKICV